MKREIEAELVHAAAINRQHRVVEGARDPLKAAIATERAEAVVHAAIARGGAAVALDSDETAALAQRFSPDMIGHINRQIAYHAKGERSSRWTLGPSRRYFEDKSARSASGRRTA